MKLIAFFKCITLIFLSIVLLFLFLGIKAENSFNEKIINQFNCYEKLIIVTKSTLSDELSGVKNGDLFYHTYLKINENEALEILDNNDYEGVVLYFSNSVKLDYFQQALKYNLSKSSLVEDMPVYYGYTSNYRDSIINKGKKVNVQLAKNEEGWVLGLPAILTGF